jgi:hypothetical protein
VLPDVNVLPAGEVELTDSASVGAVTSGFSATSCAIQLLVPAAVAVLVPLEPIATWSTCVASEVG